MTLEERAEMQHQISMAYANGMQEGSLRRQLDQAQSEGRLEDFVDGHVADENDDSEAAEDRRRQRNFGCNADDTTDSRGRRLRPKVNEAGEHWWM